MMQIMAVSIDIPANAANAAVLDRYDWPRAVAAAIDDLKLRCAHKSIVRLGQIETNAWPIYQQFYGDFRVIHALDITAAGGPRFIGRVECGIEEFPAIEVAPEEWGNAA